MLQDFYTNVQTREVHSKKKEEEEEGKNTGTHK